MKKSKKILIIVMIIVLISIFLIKLSRVEGADSVRLLAIPHPHIDVVLSMGVTRTKLDNFEQDLRAKLTEEGVDISKVNILSVEAKTVNMEKAFTWEKDVKSTIGSITIQNNGQNVTMTGNTSKPGKNAIWIIPDQDLDQTFRFGYDIDFGDSFNAAGMLLRVERTGNTLTGYLLSFNQTSKTFAKAANGSNGAIFEFKYEIGQNSTNFISPTTLILKKELNINKTGTLNVKVTNTKIDVFEEGANYSASYEFENGKSMGAGFGFFSDHYSHDCQKAGYFKLTDINLQTPTAKKFEEVLRQPEWREEAIKVMVNVEDIANEQLGNKASLGELLVRTMNDEIHFVGWGNNTNKAQIEEFIELNEKKGKYINNSNYETSLTETAKYIKSLIKTDSSSDHIILGEDITLMSEDASIMKNTAGGEYPDGRWKIIHDCEYYENNIGQFLQSGKYLTDMITSFDKTGKYEILYEDKNIIPKYIYVHRRPVAEIKLNRSGNNITLESESYDLDKLSDNQGISQEEWKYKKVGDADWTSGKLPSISSGIEYMVQLRVKDFQDTWSNPTVKYITTQSDVLPIASFKLKNEVISEYEELEIIRGSYDPFGGTITSEKWTVYKDDEIIYNPNSTPLVNYKAYGPGNYTMALEVTNNRGKTSEIFKRNFKVIPDNEPPELTAVMPNECDWCDSVTVDIGLKDRLGSGVKGCKYAITTSQARPASWNKETNGEHGSITIDTDGVYYLHIKTIDNAENESENYVMGPYRIDKTEPEGVLHLSEESLTDKPIDIIWEATDNRSGFDRIILPDGTVSKEANGRYSIPQMGKYTFIVYDKMGYDKEISIGVNNVDMKEPKLELARKDTIQEETKWTNEDVILKWKAYDNESGLKEVVLPDSKNVTQEEGEYIATENGIYTFFAYDQIGNGTLKKYEVKNIDKIGPTLDLTSEIEDNGNIKIKWHMIDNQSGIRDIILPNGTSSSQQEGEFIVKEDGTYSFIAYDRLGNDTIKRIKVKK